MTSTPRLARMAAKALDKEDAPSPEGDEAREAAVAAIRGALRDRARTNRRRRLMASGFAAVCAAAAVALIAQRPAPPPAPITASEPAPPAATAAPAPAPKAADPVAEPAATVERLEGVVSLEDGDHTTPLAEGAAVPLGRHIVSGEGTAALALPSGTRLALGRASDVRVDVRPNAQVVELGKGGVTFTVAKVPAGERFLVHAGDVEVEVRGTVFRVDRVADPECGWSTKVELLEGRVVVRGPGGEKMLVPGDRWTSCRSTATTVKRAPPPAPAASSELGEANTTFQYALSAEHAGDTALALTLYERFMQRFPKSPEYEDAAAHRMRLLEKVDPARAAAAAEDYVKRFPSGWARKDATRILERSL